MKKPQRGTLERPGFLEGAVGRGLSVSTIVARSLAETLVRMGRFDAARLRSMARAPTSRLLPVPLAALLLVLLPSMTAQVGAFETGTFALEFHDAITADAIGLVTPDAARLLVQNIQVGVQNADVAHALESKYHFDNSTIGNGGFESGFQHLHNRLLEAKNEATVCDPACRLNPLFLKPIHASFFNIAEDVVATLLALSANPKCKFEEYACPSTWFGAQATAIQAEVLAPLSGAGAPDPDHPVGGRLIGEVKAKVDESLGRHCRPGGILGTRCFDRLEDMLTDDAGFQDKARYLRTLQQEIQAYRGWQHMGHALHAAQDFFAHSNYVELAAGKKGPPCWETTVAVLKPELCDAEITGILPSLIPLPVPASLTLNLASFREQFSLAGLRGVLGGARLSMLETGWFDAIHDWCHSMHWSPPTPGVNPNPPGGLHYCHYETTTTPGLNKDRPYAGRLDEPAHKNHEYARSAATRLSAQLWAAFVHDLPAVHPTAPAPPLPLAISPSRVLLTAGDQQQFAVTPSTTVRWSMVDVGSLDPATGVYQAPPEPLQEHAIQIRADANDGTSRSATATVLLRHLPDISVIPAVDTLDPGQVRRFAVKPTNLAVTWSVSGTGGGSVETDGTYRAPAFVKGNCLPQSWPQSRVSASGSYHGLPFAASAFVYLRPTLTVSPDQVTLHARESQEFTASGALPCGGGQVDVDAAEPAPGVARPRPAAAVRIGTVTWSLTGDGRVTERGTYDAPTSVTERHTVTIKATDGMGRSASATIVLTP
jgi:hypothetical protein